jgi:hypothetical protein
MTLKNGIFTAPFDGLYTISCSVLCHPDNKNHLNIMKSKEAMSTIYSATKTHPHSSQTLQLILKTGDKIWIRNENKTARKLYDRKMYNMFSAVLLPEMYSCVDNQ